MPRPLKMPRPVALVLCLLVAPAFRADGDESSPTRLTLDQIYKSSEFDELSINCQWLPDAGGDAAYTLLKTVDEDSPGKAIVKIDAASGEEVVLVSVSDLTPAGQSRPLVVESYQWSDDLARLLIYTQSKKVWRRNTRGDYWVLDRGSGQLSQLGGEAKPSSLMFAKFSPDGDHVGYVHDGNVYVQDLTSGNIKQLTARENDRIINGTSDWVYEEEFSLRDGFRWSPDGASIAFWRFDTRSVQDFTLINNTDALYPTTKRFAYPKVGTRNSLVRIGVVDIKSADIRWTPIVGDPEKSYVPRIQWIDRTGELVVREMNRYQNTEQIHLLNFDNDTHRVLHKETEEAWIDLQDELHFADDAESFYYLSDADGWRHLRGLSVFGDQNWEPMADQRYDVVELVDVVSSADKEIVYFIASPESAIDRYLFQIDTASKAIQKLTPEGESGTHAYQISPDGRFAIHRVSTADRPTRTELVSLPNHTVIRTLEDNEKLAESIEALDRADTEFLQIDIGEVRLDAMCMKPADMDPSKKYPLIVYVYGEPAGSTVINRWGGQRGLWHTYLNQLGYVVVSIDNRGTKTPRGREFRKSVYQKIGTIGPNDQAAAVTQLLKDRPYLDAERVGVWGWSGGGSSSLHAIFRFPDLYHTAVSIAPVANQRYYDTIYQERYMGLPNENVDGFRNGSPIQFAHQLKGDLLLIHGTADDNVHYQATELLVDKLIERNKVFEMFVYPNRTHSISERTNTRRHLMTMVTKFFERTLPSGPR
ncbi:MAG: DPP IV N-terminal domain-containing protein [Planctomycetota bacterium]